MKIYYQKNRLKKQLSGAPEIKKAFGTNAKRVAQRLAEIKSAPNLEILIQIPAANCHALNGKRLGQWAVDVSGNFRMIFEIDDEVAIDQDDGAKWGLITEIKIIEIIDYH